MIVIVFKINLLQRQFFGTISKQNHLTFLRFEFLKTGTQYFLPRYVKCRKKEEYTYNRPFSRQ